MTSPIQTPEQQAKAQGHAAEVRERREAVEEAYYLVSGSEAGRDMLKDLMEFCFLQRSPLERVEGVIDPYGSHVNIGKQQVAFYVQQKIASAKMRGQHPRPTHSTSEVTS